MADGVESTAHWRYPEIPEEKIDKKAIKAISEKLDISEEWVRRLHDWQWKMAYESAEKGEAIHLPAMFRTILYYKPLETRVKELYKKKAALKDRIEKTKERIEHTMTSHWRNIKSSRNKNYRKILEEQKLEFEEIDNKIDELIVILNTKTIYAGKKKRKFKKLG